MTAANDYYCSYWIQNIDWKDFCALLTFDKPLTRIQRPNRTEDIKHCRHRSNGRSFLGPHLLVVITVSCQNYDYDFLFFKKCSELIFLGWQIRWLLSSTCYILFYFGLCSNTFLLLSFCNKYIAVLCFLFFIFFIKLLFLPKMLLGHYCLIFFTQKHSALTNFTLMPACTI